MHVDEASKFCENWLNSWTGNQPEILITFYSDDAFYYDPTAKQGFKGHEAILPYFTKLLNNNPDWKWSAEEVIPTERGFVLKWKAVIPVRIKEIVEYGVDIVEVKNGKITRNEVYFDTYSLITMIKNK